MNRDTRMLEVLTADDTEVEIKMSVSDWMVLWSILYFAKSMSAYQMQHLKVNLWLKQVEALLVAEHPEAKEFFASFD